VHSSAKDAPAEAEVTVHKDGKVLATHNGPTNKPFQFTVPSPKLWSPNSPNLYNVTVKLDKDEVESYTGFRTISRGKVDGIERPLLNGEFIFMFGTLDQGYWPDGLYTPPTREAMVYDLQVLKKLGFNMVRKHVSYIAMCCLPGLYSLFRRSKSSPSCSTRHVMSSVSL
jgi:beta-galactosidase/beta-glucuronidase